MLCTCVRDLSQGLDWTKSAEDVLRQQLMDIFMEVHIWQRITDVMESPGTSVLSFFDRLVKTKWQWLLVT